MEKYDENTCVKRIYHLCFNRFIYRYFFLLVYHLPFNFFWQPIKMPGILCIGYYTCSYTLIMDGYQNKKVSATSQIISSVFDCPLFEFILVLLWLHICLDTEKDYPTI